MSESDPQKALEYLYADYSWPDGPWLAIGFDEPLKLSGLSLEGTYVQGQKYAADRLLVAGLSVLPDLPDTGSYKVIFLSVPKQHDQARYEMACAIGLLAPDGTLIATGGNDAGGKRMEKDTKTLGCLSDADVKFKSRVVMLRDVTMVNHGILNCWQQEGEWQDIEGGLFVSRPGIFGWNKIDTGSALLVSCLPDNLFGVGADFGCGYGFLAQHVLNRYADVTKLCCLDADYQAVEACKRNTQAMAAKASYIWHDLNKVPDIKDLDFIVMNPPFHEGVKARTDLGAGFIRNAAAVLKKKGCLYMVANNHLPYEEVLKNHFSAVTEITQAYGFKVLKAIK